jgi:hypothetical protein
MHKVKKLAGSDVVIMTYSARIREEKTILTFSLLVSTNVFRHESTSFIIYGYTESVWFIWTNF